MDQHKSPPGETRGQARSEAPGQKRGQASGHPRGEETELFRRVELAYLAAFYGGMLTEKQRTMLRMHCEEDMSLAEIAADAGITRQGVHDVLMRTAQKLFDLERRLGLAQRFTRMEAGLEKCLNALQSGDIQAAESLLQGLITLDQEEHHGL